MNQQVENTEETIKPIVLRSLNLEVPSDFNKKLYAKYLEISQQHESIVKASPYAVRRSAHKLAYRSFVRDFFYHKIESGEWKL